MSLQTFVLQQPLADDLEWHQLVKYKIKQKASQFVASIVMCISYRLNIYIFVITLAYAIILSWFRVDLERQGEYNRWFKVSVLENLVPLENNFSKFNVIIHLNKDTALMSLGVSLFCLAFFNLLKTLQRIL